MRKLLFGLKQLWLGITAQRIRFALTSIGLCLGAFLFSSGLILSDSWYRTQMEEAERIPSNTMLVSGQNTRIDGIRLLQNLEGTDYSIFMQEEYSRTLLRTQLPGAKEFSVKANLIGLTGESNKGITKSIHSPDYYPAEMEIVRGRGILNADIQKGAFVAVIDELTERVLFEDHDALGKTVTLYSDTMRPGQEDLNRPLSLKIVGIAKNSYYADEQPYLLRSRYNSSNNNQILLQLCLYVPEPLLDEDLCRKVYAFTFDSEESYREAKRLISDINFQYRYFGVYSLQSRETLIAQTEMITAPVRRTADLVILMVLVLSGLTIMSILFFSTKDRLTEIAVRKTFGASTAEITLQLVSEAGLLGMLCSAAAFGAAFVLSMALQNYIREQFDIYYHVRFRLHYLLSTMLVGLTLASLSSLIPAFYAARLQVVKTMRLE